MSFVSPNQVRLIQMARRQVEIKTSGRFDEASFRLLLINVGVEPSPIDGRVSSKQLDQAGFELAMATLEEYGYRERDGSADHWRSRCNGLATTRQKYLLRELATDARYPLDAMCLNLSGGRINSIDKLTTAQAHKLIEAYKAIQAREAKPV